MSTLKELRIELGWSITRLAEEAGINRLTVAAAERGDVILAEKAKAIADALSRGYGRTIRIRSIEGLQVR